VRLAIYLKPDKQQEDICFRNRKQNKLNHEDNCILFYLLFILWLYIDYLALVSNNILFKLFQWPDCLLQEKNKIELIFDLQGLCHEMTIFLKADKIYQYFLLERQWFINLLQHNC